MADVTREQQAERDEDEDFVPLAYVRTAEELLVFELPSTDPHDPEVIGRLIRGLRQHFPRSRVSFDYEPQLRVYAKETDKAKLAQIRAFCLGFAASL